MCLGPSSILHAFEDQLLRYIFELREQGMTVSSRLVIIKASSLCRESRQNAAVPQYCSIHRYIASWIGSLDGHKNLAVGSMGIGGH